MISVKVFELGAGPRTAKVVQVDGNGTIASEFHLISAALDGNIEPSAVTFHTIRDKKIHNMPLATDKPFGELSIRSGSYIIVRGKKVSVGGADGVRVTTAPKDAVPPVDSLNTSVGAPVQAESALGRTRFSPGCAPSLLDAETLLMPLMTDDKPPCGVAVSQDKLTLSLPKEAENLKQETISPWEGRRADLVREQAKFEQDRLLELQVAMTRQIEQQHAIESAIGALQNATDDRKRMLTSVNSIQHANEKLSDELMAVRQRVHTDAQESLASIRALQGKIEESVRLLLPASLQHHRSRPPHGDRATSEAGNAEDGPTIRPFTHPLSSEEIAIHESLLQQFFDAVGHTAVSSSDLLSKFHPLSDLYDAVSLKFNLRHSLMQEAVHGYLLSHVPHLAHAAPVICFLHVDREVEFLEWVTLKSLGRMQRSPHTWLAIAARDTQEACDDANADKCYYFSSLIGLSQHKRPAWLQSIDIETCRLSMLSSTCPRLGLRNPQWMEHDDVYGKWLRSRAAVVILLHRPDLQAHVANILKFYSGREKILLQHLASTQFSICLPP